MLTEENETSPFLVKYPVKLESTYPVVQLCLWELAFLRCIYSLCPSLSPSLSLWHTLAQFVCLTLSSLPLWNSSIQFQHSSETHSERDEGPALTQITSCKHSPRWDTMHPGKILKKKRRRRRRSVPTEQNMCEGYASKTSEKETKMETSHSGVQQGDCQDKTLVVMAWIRLPWLLHWCFQAKLIHNY